MTDTCLKDVARALNRGLRRPADLLARYGGEEFAAILPSTPASGGFKVAENMERQIRLLKINHPDSSVSNQITISMGVAECLPSDGISPKQLVAKADAALYQAKTQGRNQVVLHAEPLVELP